MDELSNWLALASVHGLDGLKFQRLSEQIPLAELVRLPISTLRNIGLTPRQAELLALQGQRRAEVALKWLVCKRSGRTTSAPATGDGWNTPANANRP